jgi:hypothetical protein
VELGPLLRSLGVESVVDDYGALLATAEPAPATLAPLQGYGDTVSRGDLVRVYTITGTNRRKHPPTERLDLNRYVVHDYAGVWMTLVPEQGLAPRTGPTSIHLAGPGWRRRLELV